jgi:hypothetical protein
MYESFKAIHTRTIIDDLKVLTNVRRVCRFVNWSRVDTFVEQSSEVKRETKSDKNLHSLPKPESSFVIDIDYIQKHLCVKAVEIFFSV